MTSEPDSKPGRRPPTIELKATEVEQPAATAPSGETAAAATPPPDSPSSASPSPRSNAGSARGLKSYAVGAILGAVAIAVIAAVLWFTGVIPSRQVAAPLLPAVPETSAAMHPASTNEAAISARLDRLKRAIQLQRTPPAQNNGAAAAEAQSKVPSDSVAALTRRLNDIAAASQSATKTADAAKAAAEAAKTASANASQSATQAANDAVSKAASEAASQAASQVASQVANQVASQTAGQKSDLDALANRVAAVESAVKALSENAAHPAEGANDQAARLTIAAEVLRAAVERGAPYRAELAAVQALGVTQDATAPLEPFAAAGVPTPAALAHQLAALTPELRRASEPSSGGST
ncbi:MAG: hypothetical protein WBG15_17020, partial [Xanthobacteraceae bacterium]